MTRYDVTSARKR